VKAVIGGLGRPAGWDKEPHQKFIGYSFLSNEISFKLDKLIQNIDSIKILRFAEQT